MNLHSDQIIAPKGKIIFGANLILILKLEFHVRKISTT